MATPVDLLLKQIRQHFEEAQDAINSLVRVQVAQGLAATFLERNRPYQDDERLAQLVERGLLNQAAFLQKDAALLRFYTRLLAGLNAQRILEIGVKGGASTAFWKQLFPSATVVGVDIDLRPRLGGDGVIYVSGDQSDMAHMTELATTHGPFDLVVDDGSHVSDHQAASLRALLAHVRPGGIYVIEDVHENLKPEKGEDIWPDFLLAFFQRMRKGPVSRESVGAKLALEVFPKVADLLVSARAIAMRTQ